MARATWSWVLASLVELERVFSRSVAFAGPQVASLVSDLLSSLKRTTGDSDQHDCAPSDPAPKLCEPALRARPLGDRRGLQISVPTRKSARHSSGFPSRAARPHRRARGRHSRVHERKTLIDACEGTGPVKKLTLLFPPSSSAFRLLLPHTLLSGDPTHTCTLLLLLIQQHYCTRSPP